MTTTTSTTDAFVRPAVTDDLAAIEQLLKDADLPAAGVSEILTTTPEHFFVAEKALDGELVGVAGLELCGQHALLRSVAVRPEWRSHGVGKELVRRAVCHAEGKQWRALYLLTMTAEHYFPRFGFEKIERNAVPQEIAETLEFKSACPASATTMMKPIS